MPTFSQDALHLLRDPSQFKWYAVFLLTAVIYVYAVEIERRNWNLVFAGLALWFMDWINEVLNGVIFHATQHAALWTTTGPTAFQILIGLNFEICCMFAIAGIAFAKVLPKDPAMKVLGLPNRWVMVLGYSVFCVFVEVLLNRTGTFHWAYPFWNVPHVWLIIIFGYGTFFAVAAWAHDLPTIRLKVRLVGALGGTAAALLLVFGPVLGWI